MKRAHKLAGSVAAIAALAPFIALADVSTNYAACGSVASGGIKGLMQCATGIVEILIGMATLLASLFFCWNLVMYIKDYDNEASRTESRQYMIWGVIALFVLISVWSLVGVLTSTFGFPNSTPQLNSGAQSTGFLPVTSPNSNGSCPYGVLSNGACIPQP